MKVYLILTIGNYGFVFWLHFDLCTINICVLTFLTLVLSEFATCVPLVKEQESLELLKAMEKLKLFCLKLIFLLS